MKRESRLARHESALLKRRIGSVEVSYRTIAQRRKCRAASGGAWRRRTGSTVDGVGMGKRWENLTRGDPPQAERSPVAASPRRAPAAPSLAPATPQDAPEASPPPHSLPDAPPQDPEDPPPPRPDDLVPPQIIPQMGVPRRKAHGSIEEERTPEERLREALQSLRLVLLPVRAVLELPGPRWLLKPLFEREAFVVLYGASGVGKSFLALAWALAIALGKQWLGYDVVSPGPVVYVVGEGGRSICKRVLAWLNRCGVTDAPGAFFILEPVQLLSEDDINLLLMRIAGLPQKPVLVVLDTFAMCFDGDENSSRDVALAIAAVKRIIRETGATVVLVHHTGKKGKEERGHSALRAATDTMIAVEKKKDGYGHGVIIVSNNKQKDADEFAPITLRLKRVSLGVAAEAEEELTSCILEPADSLSSSPAGLTVSQTQALAALAAFPDGALSSDWKHAITLNYRFVVSKRTFHNWRKALQERGAVEAVPDRAHHYRVTDAGRALVPDATRVPVTQVPDVALQNVALVPDAGRAQKKGGDPRPARKRHVS